MRHLHWPVFGHWSLSPQWFLCPCLWVYYGLWLFHAAATNSDSSSKPPSAMATTLSGTMKNLTASCLGCRRVSCQIPSFLDCSSCHLCFLAAPMCPGGLPHNQASPRMQGIGLSCSWNPAKQAELSIILTLGFSTANQVL